MKRLVHSTFVFFFAANLFAQSDVQILPSSLEYVLTTDLSQTGTEAIARAIVINRSERTIDLAWERDQVLEKCPEAWTIRICDKNKYHAATTYSNVMDGVDEPIELYPGDSTILDLHVLPNGTPGSCPLEIELKDVDDPKSIFRMASFNLTVNDYSAPGASSSSLRVFPNPTTQFFSIPNNDRVKKIFVSNILGKRVKTFDTVFNGSYDLSSLPDGIYLVSMVDGQGKVLKTVRLSKRGIRP
jgi:hypothetical protein